MLRPIIRKKVIVIPYVYINARAMFMMFRDTQSGDWTFVTGGCKMNETIYESAARELYEESKSTLTISDMEVKSYFTFASKFRPPEHAKNDARRKQIVTTLYHVYVAKTSVPDDYRQTYLNMSLQDNGKEFNETNDVAFATLSDLQTNKYKMWDFMYNEVVPRLPKKI